MKGTKTRTNFCKPRIVLALLSFWIAMAGCMLYLTRLHSNAFLSIVGHTDTPQIPVILDLVDGYDEAGYDDDDDDDDDRIVPPPTTTDAVTIADKEDNNDRIVPPLPTVEKKRPANPKWKQTKKQQVNRRRNVGPGYNLTGGELPEDTHSLYPNPMTWPSIDNGTCLDNSTEPVYGWLKQAPMALLLGTMKGGTHAITEYLWEHPAIARPASKNGYEFHFFDMKQHFKRDRFGISQRKNQMVYGELFRSSYPSFFESPISKKGRRMTSSRTATKDLVAKSPSLYSVHDSPRYLLWSDRLPEAILCVTPWVKMMALLRDPIDRAMSHFRFLNEARRRNEKPMVDWEAWIDDDIRLLTEAGVVKNWTEVDFHSYSGSPEEYQGWKTYLRNPTSQMLLGRGLYAIQVQQYYEAMDRAGKPRSDFLAIRSKDLQENTQEIYGHILRSLGLSPFQMKNPKEQHHTTSKSAAPLPDHLRARLEGFFRPYNQRLCHLLNWPGDDCLSADVPLCKVTSEC